MAKDFKSLWEDYDPDKESETKKSSGSESEKKWYYADGRDNEEDDRDRTIIGFGSPITDDSRGSSDYGGYGYTGSSGYGYYDTFDDSDTDWYRRGRWRYRQHTDYSPSSQFRSAFSSRYTFGSGDDAKNKAIRALRNLTRSANTIIDKVDGKQQQSFAVQFSQGSDSNGVSATINDEKQRVVFVSPDDLLATSTTEDEDAVIDALTGFVLLRVQMSQEIEPGVIRRINATGLHASAFRAAEKLFVNKDKLEGIDASEFGRETSDDYLAGILAKSMLTRLSRRNVVTNWGGFAPYFIRHAKKFEAVRENLEKAEKSVETIVGILGYNMLADENQLELPKEINDIAAKHLGAEVDRAELLDVCRNLVAEIRDLLSKSGEPVPVGAVEKQLTEMMEKAQKEQGAASGESSAMRDLLEKVGGAMGAAADVNEGCSHSSEMQDEKMKDSALTDKLKKVASLDQLIKKLEQQIKELENVKKACDNPAAPAGAAAASASAVRNNVSYTLSSRPRGEEMLNDIANKEFKALREMMGAGSSAFAGPEPKEKIEKFKELLEKLCDKAEAHLKAQRTAIRQEAKDRVENMEKRLESVANATAEAMRRIDEQAEKIKALPDSGSSDVAGALSALESLKSMVQAFRDKVGHAQKYVPAYKETLTGARSLSTINKSYNDASTVTNSALNSSSGCFYDNYSLYSSPAMQKLTSELARRLQYGRSDDLTTADHVEAAIEATMASMSVTDMSFMASLINGFLKNLLAENMDSEHDDRKKLAEELGISLDTLNKLIAAFNSATHAGKVSPKANELGEKAAEKLSEAQAEFSPVDRHLFGEKIETKTKVLTGESIQHVNDESRNAAEEDYVAYLDHNNCKPKAAVRQESSGRGGADFNRQRVNAIRKRNKGAIERIRNALQFQSGKRTLETFGLRSGDLDEGNLHKLSYDCEHIWSQKTTSKLPDVAVGILVDQSGSMSGHKIEQARELCVVLAEAVQKITGVRLYVYGHTANMSRDDLVIYEHYKPAMGLDMSQLGGIEAHCNNYDGYAVKDVAKRLALDPAKRKYLFVIADGLPAGAGYGGETARKHVASVCKFTRDRLKIGTYAFAVGVPGSQYTTFKQQYGDNHVVFVNSVLKCLPQIVRFLRNALQQERKLVTLED